MSERIDLLNRINVMLFHFDQRLGPRLLFNVAKIEDQRITATLTRLMDFNFMEEMKAFVNAMANVVYSSLFFSTSNVTSRGGVEQFMLAIVIFEPTITEYLMISSLEEEVKKTASKLIDLTELIVAITSPNPNLEDFSDIASCLAELRDKTISIFQEMFYGKFDEQTDAISQILKRMGIEAGKKLFTELFKQNQHEVSRHLLEKILLSPTVGRWGKFSILHFDPSEEVATISVRNSIWSDSLGVIATKACAFNEGMLESFFSLIFNDRIICNEMRCSAEYSYVQECLFQISPGKANRDYSAVLEDKAIRELGEEEREKSLQMIKEDIGLDIYYELDQLIRLIQLFNKAPFISDFYFDESKFLLVCNYWRYPDDIICHDCEKWIRKTTTVPVNLTKTEHRICELNYEETNENE